VSRSTSSPSDAHHHGAEPQPGSRRALAIGGAILALVAVFLFATRDRVPAAESEGGGPLSYPRGPRGARLLSDSTLQLEMTIYETGIPPQFRVYPYDSRLRPIDPKEVDLRVELHRLGGRVDTITFKPEEEYLQGQNVVEEPHSFDVKVFATRGGTRHAFEYAQVEGKVRLTEQQLATAGITILAAGPRRMVTTLELPGEVRADETKLAHVLARVQGVVSEVFKQEGDPVRRGELLAVLHSRELADAKAKYLAMQHHVEFTKTTFEREEALWKKKISAEREYLEARRVYEESQLDLRLAEQSLLVLGVPKDSLAALASAPPENLARYEIRAPLDGRVIARDLTVGESVRPDDQIFRVADLRTVWVDITVYAKDLGSVREGQEATIVSGDLGGEVTGRVSFVGPLVGQETRTATARIVIPNPRGDWRPGLFVTARLVQSASTVAVAVAAEAIQTFRDWQVVFVRYGDQFEARPLELGRSDGKWVEVLSGLKPGVRYAAANSFAVKAEIGKLGATHDH
jgi:cobalt-zinc-cadmium efflux system membrane fusion protein